MSYPAPTTGIGVAAKINVAGNGSAPSGKQFVPGYNDVTLSLTGTVYAETFQLNPEIVDVANTSVDPGTAYTLTSVASSIGNTAVYTGTITETANSLIGKTFVVAGFVTNTVNNGTFICTANNGSTTITLENAAAVAETHAATATEQEQEWTDAVTSVASSTGVYTGTFPEYASFPVGARVTIAGFVTNAVNNGTFTLVSATSTTITTSNTASVSETHAATAQIQPTQTLTYFIDGTKNYNPTYATGPIPSGTVTEAVATVSANGLITAQALGGTVVEVSFPTFANKIGNTGAISPNPMTGLPLNKIYAEVNVTVVA